jgi:acyl-CoA thioesterase
VDTRFDADTSLTRVDAGTFVGRISETWWVGRGPNGGYLAALVLRALNLALDEPARRVRSLTLHYLEPPGAGACEIAVRVERSGRSLTTLSARLTQEGRACVLALAAFSVPRTSLSHASAHMPEALPLEAALPLPQFEGSPAFREQYAYRWAVGDPPLSGSRHARAGGWIRLAEPRLADDLLVAAYTDAWLPSIYPVLRTPLSTPTIDLTIHFRAELPLPAARPEDYYLAVFSSRLAESGVFEEDGEIWSTGGVLLAQSRQLALLPASSG